MIDAAVALLTEDGDRIVTSDPLDLEDASVAWKEGDAPFVTIARLTLPKQDAASEHGRAMAEKIEAFSFDPWHALEELRPLATS